MNLPFYGVEEVHEDEAPHSDDASHEPSHDLRRTWSDVPSFEAHAARKTEDTVGKLLIQLFARTRDVNEVKRAISSPRITWNPYRRPQGRGVKDKLQNGQVFEWRSRVAVDSLQLKGTRLGIDTERSSSSGSATRVRSASHSTTSQATSSTLFNVFRPSDSLLQEDEASTLPTESTHSIHITSVGLDPKLSRPVQIHKDASLLDERSSLMIFNVPTLDRYSVTAHHRPREDSELSTSSSSYHGENDCTEQLEATTTHCGEVGIAESLPKPETAFEFPQWALHGPSSSGADDGSGSSMTTQKTESLTQVNAVLNKPNLLVVGIPLKSLSDGRTCAFPEDEVFWSHGSVPVLEEVFILHEAPRAKNAGSRVGKGGSASAEQARTSARTPRTIGQSEMLVGSRTLSQSASAHAIEQNTLSEVFEETVEQLFDMIWAEVGVAWLKRTLGIRTGSGIFLPPTENPRSPSPPRSVQVKSPIRQLPSTVASAGVLRQPMSASTVAPQRQTIQYVLPSALATRLPSEALLPNPVRSKRQETLRPKTGPAMASRLTDVERPYDTPAGAESDSKKRAVQHPPRQAFESKSRDQSPATRRMPQPLPQQRYTMSPSRKPRPTESPKPNATPPITGASKLKSTLSLRKIVHSRMSTQKIRSSDVEDKGSPSPSLLPRPRALQPQQLERSVERRRADISPQRALTEKSPGASLLPKFRKPRDMANPRSERDAKELPK